MVLLGFHASHEQLPPSRLLDAVVRAEAAGFDGAMCSDHLAPWGVRQGESGYAWSWLGAALAATSFSLGVVTAPGQRYHPVISAQAIATLEEMFPGRFWAALGSGEAVNEHVTGDPWIPKDRRNARLAQTVEVIRELLAGDEVSRSGEIEVHRARVWSRPVTPPPLFGAAVTAETAAWVAGWADGLATVAQPPAAAQARGRCLHGCRRSRSPRAAGARRPRRDRGGRPRDRARTVASRRDQRACRCGTSSSPRTSTRWRATRPTTSCAREHSWPTTRSELADRIAALSALGFDRVYLHYIGTDQSAFLDRAEQDLLPALRRALS